jgi:hypothetical protein
MIYYRAVISQADDIRVTFVLETYGIADHDLTEMRDRRRKEYTTTIY